MDFGTASIEVRYGTDRWGPYDLDFEDALPSGERIASATIDAYYGHVKAKSSLSDFSSCSTLIEAGSIATSGHHVQFQTEYPGTEPGDAGTKCTLRIVITTSSGGVYPFLFYPVKIYGGV